MDSVTTTYGRVARESSSTESTSSILAPLTPSRPRMAVKNAYSALAVARRGGKRRECPPGQIPTRSNYATRTARSPSKALEMPPAGSRVRRRPLGRLFALGSVGCRQKQAEWLVAQLHSRHSRCGWTTSSARGQSGEEGETSPRRRFRGLHRRREHL